MAQDSNVLKQEIEQHKEGVGLWWSGHNGWIIKSEGLVISTDILLLHMDIKIILQEAYPKH
jgi:hypothetical protein